MTLEDYMREQRAKEARSDRNQASGQASDDQISSQEGQKEDLHS